MILNEFYLKEFNTKKVETWKSGEQKFPIFIYFPLKGFSLANPNGKARRGKLGKFESLDFPSFVFLPSKYFRKLSVQWTSRVLLVCWEQQQLNKEKFRIGEKRGGGILGGEGAF